MNRLILETISFVAKSDYTLAERIQLIEVLLGAIKK